MSETRHRSEIFKLASDIVERDAESDPIFATSSGIRGYDHLLPDFSPSRDVRDIENVGEALRRLSTLTPTDDIDRVGAEVMRERLESRLDLLSSGVSSQCSHHRFVRFARSLSSWPPTTPRSSLLVSLKFVRRLIHGA
jgi:hypothetical protein